MKLTAKEDVRTLEPHRRNGKVLKELRSRICSIDMRSQAYRLVWPLDFQECGLGLDVSWFRYGLDLGLAHRASLVHEHDEHDEPCNEVSNQPICY